MFECDNCSKQFVSTDELERVFPDIPDLAQRLDPGGIVPAGECTDCGTLVYPVGVTMPGMFHVTLSLWYADQRVKDLLTCATEGDVRYWCKIVEFRYPTTVEASSVQFPHIELPFMKGGGFKLADVEGEQEFIRPWVTRDTLATGLQVMAVKYPKHFHDFQMENEDAETGDVFLQCCVLDEIVFG